MTISAVVGRVVEVLPHGRSLPAAVWCTRHRTITLATAIAILLVFGFDLLLGETWTYALTETALPALLVALAW